jgi:four helix bundle protein
VKTENLIQEKSFAFSIRIVSLYRYLCKEKQEFVLSKQILKSGTSIGANVEESLGGQSDKDFISKMNIAYKEARETVYWIRLLSATGYLDASKTESLLTDADELCKILASILITLKKNS